MNWERVAKSRLTHQEVAEQVLQIYTKSLQDQKSLKSILSEFSVLEYFGKVFYGHEKVSSQLISNLHGSNYELSSLICNDQPSVVNWHPVGNSQFNFEEDLGVNLISPPKLTFPSLEFTTPMRSTSQTRKRTSSEASVEKYNCCNNNINNNGKNNTSNKITKIDIKGEQSSCNKKLGGGIQSNAHLSPQTFQTMFPTDIKYLTAYGTIRYPKRALPNMDPKRIKHHSLVTLRDRFCQLFLGFECDENLISVTNCKIWTIKYCVSSRVTPRNLLKSFNEVEFAESNKMEYDK